MFIYYKKFLNIKKLATTYFLSKVYSQISSAHWSLTSVFGTDTDISSKLSSPEMCCIL